MDARSVWWSRERPRRSGAVRARLGSVAAVMTAAATLAGGLPATATAAEAAPRSAAGTSVDVIVRELPESGGGPERAVTTAGGVVGDHIGIIDGFTAQVPAT